MRGVNNTRPCAFGRQDCIEKHNVCVCARARVRRGPHSLAADVYTGCMVAANAAASSLSTRCLLRIILRFVEVICLKIEQCKEKKNKKNCNRSIFLARAPE